MMFEYVLFFSIYLFFISIYGLITSRNMVRVFMYRELILNSVNINLIIFFDLFDSRQLKGDIFIIFIIAIVVAEVVIRLAIILSIHHNIKLTRINQSNLLNN